MTADSFTLRLALVHKMLGFYLDNKTEVDAYIADHDQEMDRQMAKAPPAPTIAELRERLAV